MDGLITPVLQMGKLRPKEVKKKKVMTFVNGGADLQSMRCNS